MLNLPNKNQTTKKAFTFLEIIIVLSILAVAYSAFSFKLDFSKTKLDMASQKIELSLKQARHQALLDNPFDANDVYWHKIRWTLKFFRCQSSVGGLYYVVYRDLNKSGHPRREDALLDTLSLKKVYSSNLCKANSKDASYVLLTQEYDIQSVEVSCNATTSLGQISFGANSKVYAKLSNEAHEHYEHEVKEECYITLKNSKNDQSIIVIEPFTGYSYKF
jgi:prepilin-type N-terminal cleavage/methylation domain-containing protein